MGGQACVLYGAAEFGRDTDLAILGNAEEEECEAPRSKPRIARTSSTSGKGL
jgi:hypothetical protein